jgi:hypothetical protein
MTRWVPPVTRALKEPGVKGDQAADRRSSVRRASSFLPRRSRAKKRRASGPVALKRISTLSRD